MTYIVTCKAVRSIVSHGISYLSIYIVICKAAIDDWSLTNHGIDQLSICINFYKAATDDWSLVNVGINQSYRYYVRQFTI